MGLASYEKNPELNKKLNKILKIDDISKEYKLNPKYIHHGKHTYSGRYTDNLIRLFGKLPVKKIKKLLIGTKI